MNACLNCAAEQDDESRFCSECGTAFKPELAATVTEGPRDSPVDGSAYSALSGSSLHGRFLPGTKVADRYRIVSLVGKGGMGEVYRADDLKLGHTGSRSSCLRQERGPVTPDVKPDRHLRVCSRHRPRNVEIAWNVAVAKNGGFTGTLRADLASQDRHARSVLTRFQPPTPAGFAAVCPGCEHRVDSLSDHR
jgi:hypothetical protein